MQKAISKSTKKLYALVFVFFFFIYLTSGGGHLDGYDGIVYFLITENIIYENSIKIDPASPSLEELKFDLRNYVRFHGEISAAEITDDEPIPKVYVNYALLLSAFAVPIYLTAIVFEQNPINFVPYFTNAIVISLTNLVVFAFALHIYKSKGIAFALSLFLGVTSFVWAYTSSMFTQPILGLCAISTVFFLFLHEKNKIKHGEIISGILLGCILLAHPTGIFLIPGIFVYAVFSLRKNKTKLAKFILFFVIIVMFGLYLNEIRFGSYTDFGYRSEQTLENHTEFIGGLAMIFSPGKGLLFLFPVSVLVPIALWMMFKENKKLVILICYIFLVTWLWFGTVQDPAWGAGGNWGPRYLIPVLPFLVLPIGMLFKDSKKFHYIIIGLAVMGFSINLLGALVWDMYGYSYGWERLDLWKLGDESWSIFTWDITRASFMMHWNVLNSDYLETMQVQKVLGGYHHVGLAPCGYDVFIFCSFGFIPVIIFACVIAVTFYFIWKNIRTVNITKKLN